jgi:hypothetical protein
LLCLLALKVSFPASADEIYRWVDANGVVNFSQAAPDAATAGVSLMHLPDSTPPESGQAQDIYNVQEQAERMQALRDEREERRKARRERQQLAAQPQPQPVRTWSHPLWYPPVHPKPPVKPRPPVPEPYPVSTFRPPGSQ